MGECALVVSATWDGDPLIDAWNLYTGDLAVLRLIDQYTQPVR